MTAPAPTLSDSFRQTASSYFAGAKRDWLDLLPVGSDLAVLELGCGSGATGALALRERRCAQWVGIEANPALAADALYALTDVHAGDPLTVELPYGGNAFDIFFCGDALTRVKDREAVLRRLVPLIRRGGEVFLALGVSGDDPAPGFTGKGVRKLLRRAGVTPERVKCLDPMPSRGWFAPRRFARIEVRGRIR